MLSIVLAAEGGDVNPLIPAWQEIVLGLVAFGLLCFVLMKFVFPQLRKLCEQRGVTWGEVDLRWGITDEEKAEGKVLPVCLAEIDSCRPYFIGILGERYGWIPDVLPRRVTDSPTNAFAAWVISWLPAVPG